MYMSRDLISTKKFFTKKIFIERGLVSTYTYMLEKKKKNICVKRTF